MPGTGPHTSVTLPARHGAGWLGLAWKLPLALLFATLLLVSVSIPLSGSLLLGLVRSAVLLWGGLVVGIAAYNLFVGGMSASGAQRSEPREPPAPATRIPWTALAIGAYAALAIPGVVVEPASLVEALGPVVALTLAAHLGRRDLQQALRDWALVIGLALYAALGFVAVTQVITLTGLGLPFFLLIALFPPMVAEALLLLLRRLDPGRRPIFSQLLAVVVATALAVSIFALAEVNRSAPPLVWAVFVLVAGLLLGSALLMSVLTMPLAILDLPLAPNPKSLEAANSGRLSLVRAFMEMSHAAMLISLAVYLALRLLAGAYLL